MEDDASVAVALARMEGKIDTNFAIIRGDLSTQRTQVDDHEARVRKLELNSPSRTEMERLEGMLSELNRWRWKLIGFGTAISVLAGVVTAFIEQAITSHN